MSGYEDERKYNSKSPIDDHVRDSKTLSSNRPLTAKRSDVENSKISKKTILRYNTRQKKFSGKDKNIPLLSKLKPTKITIEKEKLYIDNMELKVKTNELKELLIKYKSKITHLERELQKKEEFNTSTNMSSSSYLVKLLKQNIKNLKLQIQNKDQELEKQKQNMKLSKYVELELEVKAYMDECTRLRHYLEEVLKEKEEDETDKVINQSFDTKTQNLLKIIEDNNKEIQKLKEKLKNDAAIKTKSPKYQEEFSKATKEFENFKKEYNQKEKKFLEDIEKLKTKANDNQKLLSVEKIKLEESNLLIENLYKELKSLRQKKKSKISPPKCLRILNEIIISLKLTLFEYLSKLSSQNKSFIDTKDIINSLKIHDNTITDDDIKAIMNYIKYQDDTKISIKKLVDYYNTYDFSLVESSKSLKVSELFEHLSLRMQLHRIPKENLIESLIGACVSQGKTIHSQEIVLLFTSTPFNFTRKQATLMVEHLFPNEKMQTYSSFIDRFYSTLND